MKKETLEHQYLQEIIINFKTYDVDWMNFKITKDNPLQYHHIIFKKDNGLTNYTNGAPLTKQSHAFFHKIYHNDYIIGRQISKLFSNLKESNIPPTSDYYEKLNYYVEKYQKRIRKKN